MANFTKRIAQLIVFSLFVATCFLLHACGDKEGNSSKSALLTPLPSQQQLNAILNDIKQEALMVNGRPTEASAIEKMISLSKYRSSRQLDKPELKAVGQKRGSLFSSIYKSNLDKSSKETLLTRCDFTGAYITEKNLQRANLVEGNFSGAQFIETNFFAAQLEGVFLDKASLLACNLDSVNLEKAYLKSADLSNCSFRAANLHHCNLIKTILKGANFTNSDLSSSYLYHANLTGANFKNASLLFTDFRAGILKETIFEGASITGADFSNANLEQSNLSGLDFSHAKLWGASFKNANLYKVTMGKWNLNLAGDITGANFRQANLQEITGNYEILLNAKNLHKAQLTEDIKSELESLKPCLFTKVGCL